MHSNPFSRASRNSVPLPRKRETRPMTQAILPHPQGQTDLADGIANQNIDQSSMVTGHAKVEQWVATSATGPAYAVSPGVTLSQGGDYDSLGSAQEHCQIFHGSDTLPSDGHLPFSYGSGLYGQCLNTDGFSAGTYPSLVSESSFGSDGSSNSDLIYDAPCSADMAYTTSNNSNHMLNEFCGTDGAVKNLGMVPPNGPLFHAQFPNHSTWSSPSSASLEPSLPSSYSQTSLFPCQESSPTSLTAEDTNSSVSVQDEGFLPPSLMDFSAPPPFGYVSSDDLQFDPASTIKVPDVFMRAPLLGNTFWPPYNSADVTFDGVPLDIYMSRRPSGEHDNSSARRNELYQIGPKDDGLYHCPFEATDGCKHKPEKLKCNYDKHLDSHLKPYRCKVPACGSVPFSSTACLLRHEREAHGMHGHGDRPYMCSYSDCDRSLQGNGFPRRWNLMDHMKRVHDHQATPANGRASPTLSENGKSSRRRRTSTSSQASVSRVSKNSGKGAPASKLKVLQKQKPSY